MKDNNYTTANYTVSIEFTKSLDDVFNHIINLSKWWPEEFEGESIKLDSEFVFRIGDEHYSKNKVIELIPNKKVAWLTIESIRKSDNYDWTGTKMFFELTPKGDNTLLKFIYDGVVLENEKDRLVQICDFCINDRLYNFIESVTAAIEISQLPQNVFKIITADVPKWWGGKDLSGNHAKLNDEFIVNHPGAHYSKQKLIEVIPNKKVVWLVTESKLDWLEKDKTEWTGTQMIFELSTLGDKTLLNFTHYGLVPAKECYDRCQQGWNTIIKDYLFNYIAHGNVAEQLYR